MNIRETILKRIKDLRKGEEEVCFGHNVKQEEKLSDFRIVEDRVVKVLSGRFGFTCLMTMMEKK